MNPLRARTPARADGARPRPLPAPHLLMGRPPQGRREVRGKLVWILIWLVFLTDPLENLLSGQHTGAGLALGWAGLLVFVAGYLALVIRDTTRAHAGARSYAVLAGLGVLAVLLPLALGDSWLVLLVYCAVSCGAVLPVRVARVTILAVAAAGVLLPYAAGRDPEPGMVISTLLGGFAMTGVRELVRTTVELRKARATVAQLAANEERLRLARDLHDLLGHSLSLITLKSELAGRLLPARPEAAARQVGEIEQVGRQALADVREAVSGYRRPTLAGELAGAEVALRAAGIEPTLPARPPEEAAGLLAEDGGAALAWVLREAVTNVVRHSGARHCLVTLGVRQSLSGPLLELRVEDDGQGGAGGPYGNGLTGMTERLDQVGGRLDTGSARTGRTAHRGFVLTARVPLGSSA